MSPVEGDVESAALRAWLSDLPALARHGITCDRVERDEVSAWFRPPEYSRNSDGSLNGGWLAYFVDQLGGAVSTTRAGVDAPASTANLTVNYLRPCGASPLYGTARVVRAGRRVVFVAFDVIDADGGHCVSGTGLWSLPLKDTAARKADAVADGVL